MSNYILSDVATVFNGKTPSELEQRHEGFPVLKIKDVSEDGKFTGQFDSYITIELAREFSSKVIHLGDTLILNAAHNADYVGSKIYFAEQSVVGSLPTGEWLLIRPNPQKINPSYVHFWLQSFPIRQQIKGLVKGIHLYPKDVANLSISIPPLPEQKCIATILEKADSLRRLRRYALELSGTYLQVVFLEMFGDPDKNLQNWPTGRLYQICSKIFDCPHSTPIYSSTPTAYACIRSSDIQEGMLDWSTTKYVDYNEYQKRIQAHVPMPNEVVYCREGARFGNAAIIPNGKKVCLGQRMMLFQAAPNIATPEFIWAFLESESAHKQANRLVGGSASPHLNVGDIKEFITIIPPLPLQQNFAKIVQKYSRLQAQQQEAERQAEHLFQTLLHKAFQGELTVDEVDGGVTDVEVSHESRDEVRRVAEVVGGDAYQMALPME